MNAMLDYEILGYKVDYQMAGAVLWKTRKFYTEEEAIIFIKENRKTQRWVSYRLVKLMTAVIDF